MIFLLSIAKAKHCVGLCILASGKSIFIVTYAGTITDSPGK